MSTVSGTVMQGLPRSLLRLWGAGFLSIFVALEGRRLRARFGDKVMTPLIAADRNLFGRARPGVGLFDPLSFDPLSHGAELAGGVISALEARALWSRYGL